MSFSAVVAEKSFEERVISRFEFIYIFFVNRGTAFNHSGKCSVKAGLISLLKERVDVKKSA